MKIGSMVYATCQGLGILAKAFYDHGVLTDPYIVLHDRNENHPDWFPGAPNVPIRGLMHEDHYNKIRNWICSLDVFLMLETPFDWSLVRYARAQGVPTVLMPMHECTPVSINEELNQPDHFLAPSHLDYEVFKSLGPCTYIPVPVEVPWRQRTKAKVFVHNAGHGGLRGRNGTQELVAALQYIRSPAEILIRTQEEAMYSAVEQSCAKASSTVNVTLFKGTLDYDQLWTIGDVFVFPEKFNGLSLPLQEARAAGMLVMATDRFPMNQWLPSVALIPSYSHKKSRIGGGYLEFDEAIIEPKDIAAVIDTWYGEDISQYSVDGRSWANGMSWAALKPEYEEFFKGVVK